MIRITWKDKIIELDQPMPLSDMILRYHLDDNLEVLAVKSGQQPLFPRQILTEDMELTPVTLSSYDGYRIYRQSLLILLLSVAKEQFPNRELQIHQTIDKSTYCEWNTGSLLTMRKDIKRLMEGMQKKVAENIPFEIKKVSREEAIQEFRKEGQTEEAKSLQYSPKKFGFLCRFGDYMEVAYEGTVPSSAYLKEFEILPYQGGMLLRYPNAKTKGKIPRFSSGKRLERSIEEYRDWSEIMGITEVYHLNRLISEGKIQDFINLSESYHEKHISKIADDITRQSGRKKIVLISGPSSSGKTTFAARLNLHLRINGLRPLNISLDNYYLEEKDIPPDENGKPDIESLDALDYRLLEEQVSELLNGGSVSLPVFDFKTAKTAHGIPVTLEENQVLIIEGIHGLNPRLLENISEEHKFSIYCTAFTVLSYQEHHPISPTDNRLIRRIVRDDRFRNTSAAQTLELWNGVIKGEEKNIFPYEENADEIFNSALLYELPVLKNRAVSLLREVPTDCAYRSTAMRLQGLLEFFESIPEPFVYPNSVLREFIGDSVL